MGGGNVVSHIKKAGRAETERIMYIELQNVTKWLC